MTDIRKTAAKVRYKRNESETEQSKFVVYILL